MVSDEGEDSQVAENLCLQAAQKDSEARRAKNRSFGFRSGQARGVLWSVRWSEAIERNEAYEAFSAAC